MMTNKRRLLKAARLLNGIIDGMETSSVPTSNQGSSRVLLVRLKRLRELLASELEQPQPSWKEVVVPLLREAARWLGEFVINNLRIFRPVSIGHEGYISWNSG